MINLKIVKEEKKIVRNAYMDTIWEKINYAHSPKTAKFLMEMENA